MAFRAAVIFFTQMLFVLFRSAFIASGIEKLA
jgi:hypothetical protein